MEITNLLSTRTSETHAYIDKVVMEKPNLITLTKLTTHTGAEIKVIENSANYYKCIGAILLNDRYGERVETIENDLRGKGEAIIREIYKKWMREDTSCSWVTLAECFRDCNLHRLAGDIEEHFGLPSPPPQGTCVKAVNNNIHIYLLFVQIVHSKRLVQDYCPPYLKQVFEADKILYLGLFYGAAILVS